MAALAPELHASLEWLNAEAQTVQAQQGRVLALVFWNASSAYCRNLLDELALLKLRHPAELAVLGIHLPKFDAEQQGPAVLKALNSMGVAFPTANDSHWVTWQHYGIRSWPAVALIDTGGRLREIVYGDGQGAQLEHLITRLVADGGMHEPVEGPSLTGAEPRHALRFPGGILLHDNRLYVSDTGHHRVLECTLEGQVLRQFGTGRPALTDGALSDAEFRHPRGMCVLREYLYVADTGNHALRRIRLLDGEVHTVLGNGRPEALREGPVTRAAESPLNQPWDVCGANDKLYLSLTGCNQIAEYDLTQGRLRAIAGSGALGLADGAGRNAALAHPTGMALVQQSLYVADSASSAIRVVQVTTGQVQTLVGQGLYEFGNVDGQRRDAKLQHPLAVALDPRAPVLWIADTYNDQLRKLRLGGGEVSTQDLPDPMTRPSAMTVGHGALWIADSGDHEVLHFDLQSELVTRLPIAE